MIRALDPAADRAAVEALFALCGSYVDLERGPVPPSESARHLFEGELPPDVDPARALTLGIEGQDGLDGVAQVVFGYPLAGDAYIGLLLLTPRARGRGLGARALRDVEARARGLGATRLLAAVLDANPQGRRFWEREGLKEERRFAGLAYGTRVHDVTRLAKTL